ncbi:DMT family transporter [Achromobacter sp. GG226]|uniref:DMT family transporter n=1 Tax=Verticiella alkaliphila TaxID=2779529 RepID=UPI001C0E8792|nr:DMT family transporter [Verticiella sp. GG226]MBU4609759.1 DMT family transporter [Verticiella sp. GG226]
MSPPFAAPGSSHLPGIACVTGGIVCLTLSDSLAKWLGEFYAPVQLLFVRGVLAAMVIAVILLAVGGRRALRTQHLGVHAVRGVVNVASASCFYLSLTLLPLAETTAIAFAAPLIVTALSVAFLGERVDARGWLLVGLGFAGVLLVARPGASGFSWAAVLPLLTAIGYAVMMVSARRIGAQESMLTTMFYIGLGQAVVSAGLQPWFWQPLHSEHALGLAGIALFSTLGLGFITQGFRIAPASVVAPFDYTGLIWATAIGWVIWGEQPDAWTVSGALLIAGSGVAIMRRPRAGAVG